MFPDNISFLPGMDMDELLGRCHQVLCHLPVKVLGDIYNLNGLYLSMTMKDVYSSKFDALFVIGKIHYKSKIKV